MNLFLADSLNISIQLLFAVLVIVSLLLLGVVLMQRPKQEGLGAAFGAAITDQAFGARTTDVLKKATVYFGTAFMVLCLGLGMLINRQHVKSSESLLSPEIILSSSPCFLAVTAWNIQGFGNSSSANTTGAELSHSVSPVFVN